MANIFFSSLGISYFNNTHSEVVVVCGVGESILAETHQPFLPPIWQLLNTPAGNKYTERERNFEGSSPSPCAYLPLWLMDFANIAENWELKNRANSLAVEK
jgi:hypothetical protein